MRAVVDTNVVAYHLLGTSDFASEVGRFWERAGELLAPALWEAEIANVIGASVRAGVLSAGDAGARLDQAAALGIHSVAVRTLWRGAVHRAMASKVAVYDTLFVELAERERAPLITFDRQILTAFPDIARRPA
jgi:predicted nucleic acid-binding protein